MTHAVNANDVWQLFSLLDIAYRPDSPVIKATLLSLFIVIRPLNPSEETASTPGDSAK